MRKFLFTTTLIRFGAIFHSFVTFLRILMKNEGVRL